jgi:hypothetical protein
VNRRLFSHFHFLLFVAVVYLLVFVLVRIDFNIVRSPGYCRVSSKSRLSHRCRNSQAIVIKVSLKLICSFDESYCQHIAYQDKRTLSSTGGVVHEFSLLGVTLWPFLIMYKLNIFSWRQAMYIKIRLILMEYVPVTMAGVDTCAFVMKNK